jgi:hypothetical protein
MLTSPVIITRRSNQQCTAVSGLATERV